MQQVVIKLKSIITKTNGGTEYSQSSQTENSDKKSTSTSIDNSLHGELSKLIDDFDNMELESNVSDSSNSSTTTEKVIKAFSSVNDADSLLNISVPFPPQITAEEILERNKNNKTKERKKAPNNFMIYRMAFTKELKTRKISNINSFSMSVLAASIWKSEPPEVKQAYKDISDKVQDLLGNK
jgi:hypothetical protein